jgi:hypothetical protein
LLGCILVLLIHFICIIFEFYNSFKEIYHFLNKKFCNKKLEEKEKSQKSLENEN